MRRVRPLGVPLALALLLAAAPVQADVQGFSINSIAGVGDLEGQLDDRLKDDYKVNYQDCLLYLGQHEPVTGAEYEVVEEDPTEDVVTHEDTFIPPIDTIPEDDVDPEEDAAQKPSFGKADDVTLTPRILIKWSVSSAYSGYDYSVKVGSCSDTGSIADEATDSCRYVISRTGLDSYTNNELSFALPDLIGDKCYEGESGNASLYFFFQDGDFTETKVVETILFRWDYQPPVPPSTISVSAGENNLKVSWSDDSNSGETTYDVYWSNGTFDDNDLEEVSSKGGLSAKSYTITGLELGTLYYVGTTAEDEFGNSSELSELASATPVNVDDFWEQYKDGGGNENGGFCFVATAAWGSPMAPKVMVLQRFRDQVLLTSAFGRALVDVYYIEGPRLAALIGDNAVLRAVARAVLWPLVGVAWLAVEVGPAAPLLLLIFLSAGLATLRRLRRRRNLRRIEA